MRCLRTPLAVGLLALVSIAPARGGAMQSYTVTDLGTGTSSYDRFYGLNDLGQAIGEKYSSGEAQTMDQLLYTGGKVVDLGQSIQLIQTNSSGEMIAQLPVNGRIIRSARPEDLCDS